MEQLDALKDEEQEAYDNTPESLQESERGQAMEEAINQMEEAYSQIEEAAYILEELSDGG